ncbi:MAG: class I SAM-dependent methyltransferase [Desulfobacterales bacterium]|nr:class I SAM-dependent methyltransferase [Desulfobacterales bacterium]
MITVDFNSLRISPGDRILDMGCGSGRHACRVNEFEKVTVIGVDASFDDVREARGRLMYHEAIGAHGGGSWGCAVGNILALPFPEASFDLVICAEVMEHIPDDARAAEQVMRVLKPGGTLVVSVPRFYPEKICWKLSKAYYSVSGGHVRIYRKDRIKSLFENNGAKCQAAHFAHSLHTPFWWLKCLVGPDRKDSPAVNLYHRLLTWDIMKKPKITRFMDNLLNPVLGKSLVLYFKKKIISRPGL